MTKLLYIIDPLCGWCYASAKNISLLDSKYPGALKLIPSGLFSGAGRRKLTPDFADYAWSNDQRIQQITGLTFSEKYQQLLYSTVSFDSCFMNRALTLANQLLATKAITLLDKFQRARYVDGCDTSVMKNVALILENWAQEQDFHLSLQRIHHYLTEDNNLVELTLESHKQAKELMLKLNISGVPALLKLDHVTGNLELIKTDWFFQEKPDLNALLN